MPMFNPKKLPETYPACFLQAFEDMEKHFSQPNAKGKDFAVGWPWDFGDDTGGRSPKAKAELEKKRMSAFRMTLRRHPHRFSRLNNELLMKTWVLWIPGKGWQLTITASRHPIAGKVVFICS